jgi:2-dehydro-3-deoxyphosphooctonate aldolase (KDO 8-P synthase)
MSVNKVQIGNIIAGDDAMFLIAGPCVVEDEMLMMKTAEKVKKIAERLKLPLIFKSSFQKDNRSSADFYQGPGMKEGLEILNKVKTTFNLPIISDIHYPEQIREAADVVDVLQIPAYLCMQTTLVMEAAKTGKPVNIKHGQFLAPENMIKPVQKMESTGNKKIMLTERGYTFGYNDLVVDPRSFYELNQIGYPVIFDITHSIRKYGIPSADPKGGARQYLKTIGRAGVAAGVDGIFVETHPNPAVALCDAASQYKLDDLEEFLKPLIEIHNIVRKS